MEPRRMLPIENTFDYHLEVIRVSKNEILGVAFIKGKEYLPLSVDLLYKGDCVSRTLAIQQLGRHKTAKFKNQKIGFQFLLPPEAEQKNLTLRITGTNLELNIANKAKVTTHYGAHIEGGVDSFKDGWVSGWARSSTGKRLKLEIIDSMGELIATVMPNMLRKDLALLYEDSGYHGFSVFVGNQPNNIEILESITRKKIIINITQTNLNNRNKMAAGYIDQATPHSISGWAYDDRTPSKCAQIIIKKNGRRISSLVADHFREDLRLLNFNNGYVGFQFELPNDSFNDGDLISVELGNGRKLENSPWKIKTDPATKKWLDRSKRTTKKLLARLNLFYGAKLKGQTLSIVMPAYNSNPKWIEEAIKSVERQWSPNWELIIVDDCSRNKGHLKIIEDATKRDTRIKFIKSTINKGIAASVNKGIKASTGAYVAFMDHDDWLEPDAVIHLLQATANKPDLIYSDEIITGTNIDNAIRYVARPAFSYDYYLSHPYFVHMIAVKKSIASNVGGWSESMKISADVDFVLKVLASSKTIAHIPAFLYRWRTHQDSAGHAEIKKVESSTLSALNKHLQEIGLPAKAYKGCSFNTYNIKYPKVPGKTLVVIPTKDQVSFLKKCINSILKTQNIDEIKIIVIDHESKDNATLVYLDSIKEFAEVIPFKGKFNYSKMNNLAVNKFSKDCEYVLFLNNDIEALKKGWLDSLKSLCARKDVGIAGATLLYPNGTIQHSGVIIGINGYAEHAHKFQNFYLTRNQINPGYIGSLVSTREYSAVTGACMMMKMKTFNKLGGFDERLEVGFNDTDLCLRARNLGLKVLTTQNAVLTHHESLTRKKDSIMCHPKDSSRFKSKWRALFKLGDDFYNPQLKLIGRDHLINQKIASKFNLRYAKIVKPRFN